jgi:drug/metabolite transporter (DMT)-like permease
MPTPLLIPILLMVDSLHFVLARLMLPHIDPSLSPMYVLLIASIEVGLFGLATRRIIISTLFKNLWMYLAIGFLVAASMTINYTMVEYIDPGTASMLTETGVIWGLLLGVIWLREKLMTIQVWGSILAIFGVFTISYQPGNVLQISSILIVVSAFMYALHAAIAKRYSENVDLFNFFFARVCSIAFFGFLFAAMRDSLARPSAKAWPLLLLSGTVDVVISRFLYYVALRRMKLSVLTIILTLSPVVSVLWAFTLFRTLPSLQESIGGFLVLIGAILVNRYQSVPTPFEEIVLD